MQAFFKIVHDLHFGKLGFRIGTPLAAKGTALEKYRAADSRTVVNGEFLDIEYSADRRHVHTPGIVADSILPYQCPFVNIITYE